MKMLKKYVILAVVLVLTLNCLTGCGKKKIDVMYDLALEFSGIDGEGRAEVDFENTELGFVDGLVISGDEEFESFGDLARLDAIARTVEFDVEPSEGLSNGDKVTVTATVDSKALKELGYSAKTTSKTFIVEGLAVPTEIDAFKDFDVTFSGISPMATAEFEPSREVDGATVRYTCENNGTLRIGEPVTITASVNDKELYILEEESKEFTVEGVDTYISNPAEIPEGLWGDMQAEAAELNKTDNVNDYMLWEYSELSYLGYGFGISKENYPSADPNCCYLIYEGSVFDGEENFNYYFYRSFEDLILRTDGTWAFEIPAFGSRPSRSESFPHNVVKVYGYETLAGLEAGITEKAFNYDMVFELP